MNLTTASAVLAFIWHTADAFGNFSKPHRRARNFWIGIGVGWSLFQLISNYKGPQMVETKNPETEYGTVWIYPPNFWD
jgi:hypothetical protein